MSPTPTRASARDMFERAVRLTPEQIAAALREGWCPPERAFDRFLPEDLQFLSSSYWTPLPVVLRAVEWFEELGVRTVVDVGSGAGKFVVAAALASRCTFVGIEQRPRLVASARALAELFEVDDRVEIVEAAFGEAAIPPAQAYYLFNPFGENLYGKDDWIDADVEMGEARYEEDVAAVERLLRSVPVGTFLITYNGFGGRVPWYYREVRADLELPSVLRMWQKTGGLTEGV